MMKALGLLLWSVILLVVGSFWRGVAVMYVWAWFVVPLGPQPITYIQAVGLSILMGMAFLFTYTSSPKDDEDVVKKMATATAGVLVCPPLLLVLCWLVHVLLVYFAA